MPRVFVRNLCKTWNTAASSTVLPHTCFHLPCSKSYSLSHCIICSITNNVKSKRTVSSVTQQEHRYWGAFSLPRSGKEGLWKCSQLAGPHSSHNEVSRPSFLALLWFLDHLWEGACKSWDLPYPFDPDPDLQTCPSLQSCSEIQWAGWAGGAGAADPCKACALPVCMTRQVLPPVPLAVLTPVR